MTLYSHGDIPWINFICYLILVPVEMFCGCFVVWFYIKVKSFRSRPGDLFCIIAVLDVISGAYHGMEAMNS